MALLSGEKIIELVKSGQLKIEPFTREQVGPGSIDLHLGHEFRVFKRVHDTFQVTDEVDFAKITETVKDRNGRSILIMPGELIHGITKEKVTLPSNLAALIQGRSSLARVGLLTHLSSGFVHPGSSNRTVLEIANISPMPLSIKPGIKICQLIILEVSGEARYRGRFADQLTP